MSRITFKTLAASFLFILCQTILAEDKNDDGLNIRSVNAWALHATVSATCACSDCPTMEYRKDGDSDWIKVSDVRKSGQNVTGELANLLSDTFYRVRLRSRNGISREYRFRTEQEEQLPNMSFDEWYQADPHGTWYLKPGPGIWDTPDKGINVLSTVNPVRPESDFVAVAGPGKKAARLETVVYMFTLGAGTIYAGQFGKPTVMPVGAIMKWGTPFHSRPSALKGYYAYSPKKVDHTSKALKSRMGLTDSLKILIFLTDWDQPFELNTGENILVDQEHDPHIIAHGVIYSGKKTVGPDGNLKYVPFTCPLKYRDTTRKPKYIVVISCSSHNGDTFTGAEGSVLYVDEFTLSYE